MIMNLEYSGGRCKEAVSVTIKGLVGMSMSFSLGSILLFIHVRITNLRTSVIITEKLI